MNVIPFNNNYGLQNYHPQGLNGIFGFIKKAVGTLASGIIKRVGYWVAGKIDTISPAWGQEVRNRVDRIANMALNWLQRGEIDITAQEGAILDAWATNKVQPFIQGLIDEIKAAKMLVSNAAKLGALNAVLNKITIAMTHFEEVSEPGLSEKAMEERSAVLYELLDPIYELAEKSIMEIGAVVPVTVTVNPASYSFSPLFSSTPFASVESRNYKSGQLDLGPGKVPTNPTKGDNGDTPVIVLPVDNGTTNPEKSISNTGKIIAGAAVIAVLAWGFRSKKKKSKK